MFSNKVNAELFGGGKGKRVTLIKRGNLSESLRKS